MEHPIEIGLDRVSVAPLLANGSQGAPILKSVTLAIRAGEWVTLLGANGSGKSTLMKLLAGMPMQGRSGEVIRAYSREASSGAIPLVLQQPDAGLIGATPWEDVVSLLERNGGDEASVVARAEAALHALGLGGRMKQPIETLSGGQKQLTAIAGCMAVHAPILLLDEVTSMLDPVMSREVLDGVRRLHGDGSAVVWATQRLEELRPEDRVVCLKDGEVLFDGEANDLFRRSAPGAAKSSAAERLGMEPPYAIQVAWELMREGVALDPLPFTAEQLAEAVQCYAG
ncbi:ABC transporter ATP-binding protein [Paenibacillus sp. PL2-23]|uniref:ABC transporter ATP-binding protein n=1 Tax=Paenibacillus sp. PL2-23 TaxID=2100729 RepID=UPI0030FC132D